MPNRRAVVTAIATSGFASLAGCLSVVLGDEPLEFHANGVRLPDDVLQKTGYELVHREELTVDRSFKVGDRSRDVVVTNQLSEHEKGIDLGPIHPLRSAVFSVISTPSVSVLGREFNPLAGMDTREIAEMTSDQYDGIEDLSHVADETIEIRGTDTIVSTFVAELPVAGTVVEISLHIAEAIALGDDLAIAVGIHPALASDEKAHVLSLMRAIEPDE